MPLLPPVTTATLPASEVGFSVVITTSSIAHRSRPGDFCQDLVETVGSLVLRPVPGAGDHFEAGARLRAAHHAGALLEMGTGGRIALSPDAVEAGLDERQSTGERVRPRKPSASDAAARRVLRLDVDRELVDLRRVGDHQDTEIVAVDGESLGYRRGRPHALESRRLAHQPEPVRSDDRQRTQPVAELCSYMTTEHAAEGEAGDVRSHILWQHDIEAFDQDCCQAFGGVGLG